MQVLEGQIDNKTIGIITQGDGKPCYLRIDIQLSVGDKFCIEDHIFDNPRQLSANFCCDVGIGPAREFLKRFGVAAESQLASLNHYGLHG